MNAPDLEPLLTLQKRALSEGKTCVVGALITDEQGRIFVQRHAWSRKLFPGCWDLAGGHAHAGETLTGALTREIFEETGWTLRRIVAVVAVLDWETQGLKRREFDFLVEVEGDLAHPVLERGKITKHRWLGAEQVEVLKENRRAEDLVIFKLVRRALERYKEHRGVPTDAAC